MNKARCQANLTRLLADLEGYRSASSLPTAGTATPACRIAEGICLSHATSDASFSAICKTGRIYSKRRLDEEGLWPMHPKCVELVLGTENDVFFFAAPFAFPESGCGVLFGSPMESEHPEEGTSTPFDSGGLLNYFQRPDMVEEPADFLRRHEVPPAGHREYLRQCLSSLYADPFDYIHGPGPAHPGPIGLSGGDRRRWTHEVRLPGEVALRNCHLQVVFVPRAIALNKPVKAFLKWCHSEGIQVEIYDSGRDNDFDKLLQACSAYLAKLLN